MTTLELTQQELELIRERRKTYDVEKVKAEEKITKDIEEEVQREKNRIFEAIQDSRKVLKFNRSLVHQLNEEAGENLFRLEVTRDRRKKQVKRYYYTNDNGIRYATSYVSIYSDDYEKYGPEVIEWEKEYTELRSKVVHFKYPFVYLSEDNYTQREGRYFNISGFGYDVEKRSMKRLSSIVTKVKDLVNLNRGTLEERVFRKKCEQEFKENMELYLASLEGIKETSIYSHGVHITLNNGIAIRVELEISTKDERWTTRVDSIQYPTDPSVENIPLIDAIEMCRDWKPLPLID